MSGFLPITKKEMRERGITQFDFVYVIGDAYVDHPSFGHAIISRLLESHGYSVGIISQPDWKNDESIAIFGEPRLGFLVSAGNMDSMVNHYSVSKKRRQTDAYTPGGVMGKRPDRALTVYSNLIRRTYKKTPIILGGIEASLRRLAHYDYWSNSLKRSVLLDSGADILSYGMGERSILAIAEALDAGIAVSDIGFIPGTVYKTQHLENVYDYKLLPSFEVLQADKTNYAKSFYVQYCNTDSITGKRLVEPYPNKIYVVQNPPAAPLSQEEMDEVYAYPYMRTYHPSYEKLGGVPAISEIKFCSREQPWLLWRMQFLCADLPSGADHSDQKPRIHRGGGEASHPGAGFQGLYPRCGRAYGGFSASGPARKQETRGVCPNRQCLFPKPCKNLRANHEDYLELLHKLRELPKVKKVFIRSGIRFDYVLADPDDTFFRELVQYHISGQLKVAPEHVSDQVLHYMGKPEHAVFMQFTEKYKKLNEKYGMNQFLVPYLMSSHPGCTMKEAVKLAEYLRDLGYMPEQVQDFYPTPSTISTCMYYTGLDPRTMEQVYVPTNPHEKAMQRALIQYRNPKNYDLVKEALIKAHRTDLIGYDKHCLIRPEKPSERPAKAASGSSGKRTGGKQQGGGDFRGAKGKNSSGAKGHRSPIRNTQKKKGK